MECLENIIGISKLPCACLGINATTSLSGLYLDDTTMRRLPLSSVVFDCSDADINAFLSRVRSDAVNEVIELLYTEMQNSMFANYRDTFIDFPVNKSFSAYLTTKPWHYITITPIKMKGLYLKLNSVSLPGNSFKIIGEDGVVYYDDLVANFTPMRLQLDKYYHIAYQPTGSVNNALITCCGRFDEYKKYLQITGGSADSESNIKPKSENYANGITFKGLISCDPFSVLCELDYQNNNWGRVFATTVLLVARKNLLAWIIDSGLITNYLTVNEDKLDGLFQYYLQEISDRIKFMPTRMDFTDCYNCNGFVKSSILI